MKSLDAHGITAKFDPWGVFLRQWRFTDVRVQSGDVEIQIYKANPEAVPAQAVVRNFFAEQSLPGED